MLASVDGQLLPMPINLDTINQMYGLNLTSFQVEEFFASQGRETRPGADQRGRGRRQGGARIVREIFQAATRASNGASIRLNWMHSVTARVPTRTNRDNRYFVDSYQSMPLHGFTRMFENMLDHPNIKMMLNTDYRDVCEFIPFKEMIYTGPIDEYFDYPFRQAALPLPGVQARDPRPAPVPTRLLW